MSLVFDKGSMKHTDSRRLLNRHLPRRGKLPVLRAIGLGDFMAEFLAVLRQAESVVQDGHVVTLHDC